MKTILLPLAAFAVSSLTAPAALIFQDTFNAPDTGNLDLSDQTGRRSGLDTGIQVRSSRVQHGIAANRLNFLNASTGRVRFHNDPDNNTATAGTWHDWATGAGGAAILGGGGVRVEFDWIAGNNTSDNWVAFNIGHSGEAVAEPGFRVNDASNDLGILFRLNGATQVFDNAVDRGAAGSFPATIGNRHVLLDYAFTSFADGATVGIKASVDGVSVYNNSFTWDGNAGQSYMELETLENTAIDNLRFSTIPEPSVAALGLLCGLGSVLRRRRAR